MAKLEATGKTIDDAIKNALAQLDGVDRDMVSVEVLENPKSGFLGLGGTLARVAISYDEPGDVSVDMFLEGLLSRMGAEAVIETKETEEGNLKIELSGENMGILIGRRGETLDAIQHITNLVANRKAEHKLRVTLDTEHYREKREEALEHFASKVASQVIKYRRNKVLEPMNAYERHIIHAALQDTKDISTSSTGVEPNRRVVVSYTGVSGNQQRSGYRGNRTQQ